MKIDSLECPMLLYQKITHDTTSEKKPSAGDDARHVASIEGFQLSVADRLP